MKFQLLVCAHLLVNIQASPSIFSPGVNSTRASDCASSNIEGFICISTNQPAMCSKVSGQWVTTYLPSCNGNERCNQQQQGCVEDFGRVPFTCTSSGLFPDPFDCTAYHLCEKANDGFRDMAVHCDENYAFNVLTNTCDIRLDNQDCSKYLNTCDNVKRGRWSTSTQVWYDCVKIGNRYVPILYRCPGTDVYDEAARTCVSYAPPAAATTTTTPAPGSTVDCRYHKRQPDPTSCYHYYKCVDGKISKRVHCDDGSYYNKRTEGCKWGRCPY